MIEPLPEIKIGILERISPSNFESLKNCPYKLLLAKSSKEALLPLPANAYFGTIIHKIIESISKGIITNNEDFNEEFKKLIKETEEKMSEEGHSSLTPLQLNIFNYGIKKIQLKRFIHEINFKKNKSHQTLHYSSEKFLQSKDETVAGTIDLIVEGDDYVEISDYKTGKILDNPTDDPDSIESININYSVQLKLYAYLYFENFGKFPDKLSIIDLSKRKYYIEYTHSECQDLFDEAKAFLNIINDSIRKEDVLAKPSESNCKYCINRPACKIYVTNLKKGKLYSDLSGVVEKVSRFESGNIKLYLKNTSGVLNVNDVPETFFNDLKSITGERIYIFNLYNNHGSSYTSKKNTAIWKE